MSTNAAETFQKAPTASNCGKISFYITILLFVLLPFFFIPSDLFSIHASKVILLVTLVSAGSIAWIVERLKSGSLFLPLNIVVFSSLILVFVLFLSSIFSDSPMNSLIGNGMETGTFSFVLILFMLMMLVSSVTEGERLRHIFPALFVPVFILGIIQAIRIFGGNEIMSLGVLRTVDATLIGKWHEMAIFFGGNLLLSVVALDMSARRRIVRAALYLSAGFSAFFVAVANIKSVWMTVGIISVVLFAYLIYIRKTKGGKFPSHVLISVILAVVFLLGSSFASTWTERLGINPIEPRLSWDASLDIAKGTLSENPLLGSGLNRFEKEWLIHKPKEVNTNFFWSSIFGSSRGYIPTFAVTSGVLGILAWIIFLGFLFYNGLRALLSGSAEGDRRFFLTASFFASLFLWVFAFIYVPGPALLALTFGMTGLLIACLYDGRSLRKTNLHFLRDPQVRLVSVIFLVAVSLGVAWLGYANGKRFASNALYLSAVDVFSKSADADAARERIESALRWSKEDTYYRALSEISLLKMNNFLLIKDLSKEESSLEFQQILSEAIRSAKLAVQLDPGSYQNQIALARVYEAVAPLGIVTGSYETAVEKYESSRSLNPNGPQIPLALARLEFGEGKMEKARTYVEEALEKKPNYAEAIFLKAQIEIREGKIESAIKSVEQASLLSSDDPGIFFQLGLLHYKNGAFKKSVTALEKALRINPNYSDARYFLGLSFHALGNTPFAIAEFEKVKFLNPGRPDVGLILDNLKTGKNPLQGIAPSPSETDLTPAE